MKKTRLTIILIFFPFFVFSKSSSILIDAKTGNEIVSHNADFVRYPASLTKVLTLYIVFDQLKAGNLSLDELITITPNAVRDMPNFKLYRVPGATITVDQAIRATAIKSANDTAVALGEHIAGSEQAFVAMMNRKAVKLGMDNSHFHHPAGLPSPKQTSTARDLAKLARSILMVHPEYAYFFSIPYFYFHNRKYKNTNSLLGAIKGVDGMKTGYTRVAGHCLIASQELDDQRVIGVVMGESSPHRRDLLMTYLLEKQTPTLAQIREAQRKIRSPRVRGGGVVLYWAVQTGAFRTRKQAISFNRQMKKKHQKLFVEKNFFTRLVHSVRLQRKHYTSQIGRFSSRHEAQNLCNSMQKKSLSCTVVKTK